jgi:cell division protein FtsB
MFREIWLEIYLIKLSIDVWLLKRKKERLTKRNERLRKTNEKLKNGTQQIHESRDYE